MSKMRRMAVMMAAMAMSMSASGMPEYVQQGRVGTSSSGLNISGGGRKRRFPLPDHKLTSIPKGHTDELRLFFMPKGNYDFEYSYYITWGTRKSRTKAIAKAEAMIRAAIAHDSFENLRHAGVTITPLDLSKEIV
jgi:hypothetical protein